MELTGEFVSQISLRAVYAERIEVGFEQAYLFFQRPSCYKSIQVFSLVFLVVVENGKETYIKTNFHN